MLCHNKLVVELPLQRQIKCKILVVSPNTSKIMKGKIMRNNNKIRECLNDILKTHQWNYTEHIVNSIKDKFCSDIDIRLIKGKKYSNQIPIFKGDKGWNDRQFAQESVEELLDFLVYQASRYVRFKHDWDTTRTHLKDMMFSKLMITKALEMYIMCVVMYEEELAEDDYDSKNTWEHLDKFDNTHEYESEEK